MLKKDRQKAHNSRGRFEQWVKNPNCQANVVSAVHGFSMDLVAKKEGYPATKGQSPFAIARGKQFERALFRENAERLIAEAKGTDLIPSDAEVSFHDFRQRSDFGPYQNIEDALQATRNFFSELKTSEKFYLLAGPVVVIPGSKVMLPEALLILDALVLKPTDAGFEAIIGEVKTYPDRSGFTDPTDLSGARAQAGIYVHALRLVLAALGCAKKIQVSDFGFLVLSKPGSNYPSLRNHEDLKHMAERAERGFERLRLVADGLKPKSDEELLAAIQGAETQYREDCLSFCDRAPHCLSVAAKAGAPVLLGHEMERFLGDLTLHRAIELMEGKSKAKSEAEKDFLSKLQTMRTVEVA